MFVEFHGSRASRFYGLGLSLYPGPESSTYLVLATPQSFLLVGSDHRVFELSARSRNDPQYEEASLFW